MFVWTFFSQWPILWPSKTLTFPHDTPCTSEVQEFVTASLIGRNPQPEAVSLLLSLWRNYFSLSQSHTFDSKSCNSSTLVCTSWNEWWKCTDPNLCDERRKKAASWLRGRHIHHVIEGPDKAVNLGSWYQQWTERPALWCFYWPYFFHYASFNDV